MHDSLSLKFIFIRSSCLFTNTISSSLSIKHATGQSSQTQREYEYFECEYFEVVNMLNARIISIILALESHCSMKSHRIPFRAP